MQSYNRVGALGLFELPQLVAEHGVMHLQVLGDLTQPVAVFPIRQRYSLFY